MPLSHYLRVIARALLLLLCSSSISCLGDQWHDCRSVNSCGTFSFGYPFGIRESGCGDPDFQLDCDHDHDSPLLNIIADKYHISEPYLLENSSSKHIMTIVIDDICTLSGNHIKPWLNGSRLFYLAAEYTYMTVWGHCTNAIDTNNNSIFKVPENVCGDLWYYTSEFETLPCETRLEVPIKGKILPRTFPLKLDFEITWSVDRNKDQSCGACLKTNGACGYNNISEPPEPFACYCPDGTSHPDKCPSKGGPNKSPIIIGCSIGGVALTAIALVLFLKLYGKRRKQPPPPPRSSISKVEKFLREYVYEMPTRYSQSDLKKMTNNFAEMLGEGGFGVVYKGKLRNGALVAVKLLDRHRHNESAQFVNEVATIGRVHHVNLVRLLGYCFESPTTALVYEYMVNGSLEKFIFAGKEQGQVLGWKQLYSIALGAARGIAYLHQDCEKRIIHFDIKPHNILLDTNFAPKVADFGLAKLCEKEDDHISMSAARGTPGYVAPELCDRDHGSVTDKADVYSFGMLLLEIVGGRKNIDWKVSRSSQFYFPEWAFKLLESGELETRLRGGGEMEVEDEENARKLTKVGLWCVQYNSTDRPCMSRVVQMLEGNGDDVSTPPLPFNSSVDPENPLLSSTVTSSIEIRL